MGRAKKAIDELIAGHFIICKRGSSFNMKTGRAREWMLTTRPMEVGAASNDWKKNSLCHVKRSLIMQLYSDIKHSIETLQYLVWCC